ncbi:MAG: NrfD/PsrC family molybdoenzyme membrane anchor subunit [bacterium]
MEHINWGIPVAFDLFLAGLGAGALLLATAADLFGQRRYERITRTGAALAPWPVIIGVILLIIDLGQPGRFSHLLFRQGPGVLMVNLNSVMSTGVWLLTIFIILSLVYAALVFLGWPFTWGRKARRGVGMVTLVVSLLVAVYTGVLLAATSNPLWNTFLLPAVFSVSALATGIAAVVFILALGQTYRARTKTDALVPELEKINSRVISLQLVVIALFVLLRITTPSLRMILGSGYGLLWWIGIIGLGLVVPLVFGFKGKTRKPQTSVVVAALVLLGSFFLRYVILIGGQIY